MKNSEELTDNDQEKPDKMSFVISLCLAGCIIPHLVFSANQSVSFTFEIKSNPTDIHPAHTDVQENA